MFSVDHFYYYDSNVFCIKVHKGEHNRKWASIEEYDKMFFTCIHMNIMFSGL